MSRLICTGAESKLNYTSGQRTANMMMNPMMGGMMNPAMMAQMMAQMQGGGIPGAGQGMPGAPGGPGGGE